MQEINPVLDYSFSHLTLIGLHKCGARTDLGFGAYKVTINIYLGNEWRQVILLRG